MERFDGGSRRIPETTIRRLPVYLRALGLIGQERVTSDSLGQLAGYTSEQVRKDLAYFGAFGTRGVGYDAASLTQEIRRILQLDHGVKAIVVGAGRLGTALVLHAGEADGDVQIAAVLDINPQVIGKQLNHLTVQSMDRLESLIEEHGISMGIIAVTQDGAQQVMDRLVRAGVLAILNFAPTTLTVGNPEVVVQHIDFTLEMQALAYFARSRQTARS